MDLNFFKDKGPTTLIFQPPADSMSVEVALDDLFRLKLMITVFVTFDEVRKCHKIPKA